MLSAVPCHQARPACKTQAASKGRSERKLRSTTTVRRRHRQLHRLRLVVPLLFVASDCCISKGYASQCPGVSADGLIRNIGFRLVIVKIFERIQQKSRENG